MEYPLSESAKPTKIENDVVVVMNYSLTVDGEVVDSSEESGPIAFLQGRGNIIAGLERELAGLKIGDSKHVTVQPGMVAGCKHTGRGFMNGREVITLEHPQQIQPEFEGVETGDYIWIEGEPNINLSIKPEIPGGIGTIAMAVNMMPHVINAGPGVVRMTDLPLPRVWASDIREFIQAASPGYPHAAVFTEEHGPRTGGGKPEARA